MTTLLIIILIFLPPLAYHYTRPSVNVILSEAEEPLLSPYIPSGLFGKYNVKVTVYPETWQADNVLYSPLAGILAANSGTIIPHSAVWGLEEGGDDFFLSFTPSEETRWLSAFESHLPPLASAVIMNAEDPQEELLADLKREETVIFAYSGSLSRVSADEMKRQLSREGVGLLYVFSPENVLHLLSGEDGYAIVVPLLYGQAFSNDESGTLYLASEDFEAMFDSLSQSGTLPVPYTLIEADKGFEVLLHKFF